jgi:SAM-dependent methyltransferase
METPRARTKPDQETTYNGRIYLDLNWLPQGVTAQFLENAAVYHQRYFNNDHWNSLVARGLSLANVDRMAPASILDIGSGSGNTVFPALRLMPNATLAATDISPQLLDILIETSETDPSLKSRVTAYCFDLHVDFFENESFDLAIGGSFLHHMLDPIAALANVVKWLRPGGSIIIFEPLEIGAHAMTAIYLNLLDELEDDNDCDARLITFFKAMRHDYEARFGIPRLKPWTALLDDKWLFHASYLRTLAGTIGAELVTIEPVPVQFDKMFEAAIRFTLNAAGLGDVPTPSRLWRVVESYDLGMSTSLKRKFSPEGVIVLKKPG